MKSLFADLNDVVVSSYDQTKTTIQGRITQKTIDGDLVLGPPLNKFIDVFADAAITPVLLCHMSPNGRLFTWVAPSSGVATLSMSLTIQLVVILTLVRFNSTCQTVLRPHTH